VRLPEISVTGPARLPAALPRSWVPNSVDVVPGVEIGTTQPTELPELLRRLPGVTLQDEQGSPRQPDLTLRGFTVSPITGVPQGISVFLDGVRLNEPTVEEVNFDLIPLGDIDRVEVIRGASVLSTWSPGAGRRSSSSRPRSRPGASGGGTTRFAWAAPGAPSTTTSRPASRSRTAGGTSAPPACRTSSPSSASA